MSWFVAYTKFRSEFKSIEVFEKTGLEAYVPYLIEKRQWSDRIKKVKKPAISGYVFFKTPKLCYDTVNLNPFVKSVVRSNGVIVKIGDEEIEELKSALSSYSNSDKIEKGRCIQIENGLLKYRRGIVKSVNKHIIEVLINKLTVKLSLKQTSVSLAS